MVAHEFPITAAVCRTVWFFGLAVVLACSRMSSRSGVDGGETLVPPVHRPEAASFPRLVSPVDCPSDLGCIVRNFVDCDPGPGASDYRSGRLTYDGHDGTDIRVPDGRRLADGVVVLAAADGVVLRTRGGVEDVSTRVTGREVVDDHMAGNSVIIDHGAGWETQYSHLRHGSVRVQPEERVVAGQPIAVIGLSGATEFLHLHFEVRHDGVPVDPYSGDPAGGGCRTTGTSLWTSEAETTLSYRNEVLFDAGFATEEPEAWSARAGAYVGVSLTPESPMLVFWVDVIGLRPGDAETTRIVGPDGAVLTEHAEVVSETRVQSFRYAGKKRSPEGWPSGRYVGEYRSTRGEGAAAGVVFDVQREIVIR